jgi:hypothetical protein
MDAASPTAPGTAATAVTTAGLRGAYWNEARLPKGTVLTVHALRTEDGAIVTGYLFRCGGERAVLCAMHPRELLVPQYLVPEVLNAGCAMWVQGPRSVGNDIRLEHETAIVDMAAGQVFLEGSGYAQRVLIGLSGGGPLAAFYVQQSTLPPDRRLARSPAGRPTSLTKTSMPPAQGVILLSAHLGQGPLLLRCIDPSVTDERDPMSVDEALSPFNAANGFKRPPESARYSADFVASYREAQCRRIERIEANARRIVDMRAEARRRGKEKPSRADAIVAAHTPIFNIWRTDADLRCFDLSLDPSERAYGSLWGPNPIVSNYGSVGFARVCTAESWLSNWSAISSNATMAKCAPSISQPCLMIEFTADNGVFPSEADALFDLLPGPDKERRRIHGNHHGQPVLPNKPDGQIAAGQAIADWLGRKRFT